MFHSPLLVTVTLLLAAACPGVRGMEIIAHRGAMKLAPENTLASQRLAYELGADYVEVDVRITRDGIPVNMHDPTLDRTTDGTGVVHAFTLAQLKALDAGSWFAPEFAGERVPTIAEALEVARQYNRKLMLDVKAESIAPQLAAVIQASGIPLEQIAFLAWSDSMTAAYTSRLPGVRMMRIPPAGPNGAALTTSEITAAVLTPLKRQKVDALFLGNGVVTRADVDRIHAGGFEASVIYVNPATAFYYQDLGVDTFWTDFTDVTVTSLQRLSQQWNGWAAKSGLAPDQQSTWMDPDGDGMTNLAEYALATDPLMAGNFPAPLVTGPGTLGWTLHLREDWSQFTTVTAQTSNGSGAWVNAPASCCTALSPVQLQFNFPVTPGKKFFRMKFDLVR
jgi:glycerophosphoryl diester phosphodiesterase